MNELRELSKPGAIGHFLFFRPPSGTRWAALPLRLIVGYGFMEHGFAKLSKGR